MITEAVPSDWKDLQQSVAQLLKECGFAVEIEKTVATVRGSVEIDVYAEEQVRGRKYVILVECKHWKSRVPQGVIHAFRTVVSDIGANVGYLVSMAGFQSGAFTAAELTNLRLLNWAQFQDEFERTWYETHLMPTVADRLDALLSYTEPFLPAWFDALSETGQREYLALKDAYDRFGVLMMMFTPYSHLLNGGRDPRVPLPLRDRLGAAADNLKHWPNAVLDSRGYKELLTASTEFGEQIVARFRQYRPADVDHDDVAVPMGP